MEENHLKRNLLLLGGILILLNLAFYYHQITDSGSEPVQNYEETPLPAVVDPQEQAMRQQLEELRAVRDTESPSEEDVGKELETLTKTTKVKPPTEEEMRAKLDQLKKP